MVPRTRAGAATGAVRRISDRLLRPRHGPGLGGVSDKSNGTGAAVTKGSEEARCRWGSVDVVGAR